MKTCFVVDDHPFTTEGIKAAIASMKGHAQCIGEATNIRTAEQKISAAQPDWILIDHYINDETGFDLIELLEKKVAAERFVLISQVDNKAVLKKYLDKGVRILISKISAHEDLVRALARTNDSVYLCPVFTKILATEDSSELLTPRELEVVRYVAQGKTNKEIGQSLSCSEFTIKSHKSSIMRKLDFSTSVEIGVWALKNKVI